MEVRICYKSPGGGLPGTIETYTTKLSLGDPDLGTSPRSEEHFKVYFKVDESQEKTYLGIWQYRYGAAKKGGKAEWAFRCVKQLLRRDTDDLAEYNAWLQDNVSIIYVDGFPYWMSDDENGKGTNPDDDVSAGEGMMADFEEDDDLGL